MKANILIVDDEESIRFSFRRFLTAEGHHVTTAASYSEALEKMDERKFDLILADIVLDDGFGINILQEVQHRILKTRVIVMTAYPSTKTVQLSSRLHAADYLVKPLRQKGLLDAVTRTLQQMEGSMDKNFAPRQRRHS
ncbi:MAG: response regulator [Bacteroidales bacterium]|nr:response regulator [Bacteroidales bacterium]